MWPFATCGDRSIAWAQSASKSWSALLCRSGISIDSCDIADAWIFDPTHVDDGELLDRTGAINAIFVLVDAVVRQIGPIALREFADRDRAIRSDLRDEVACAAVSLSECPPIVDAGTAQLAARLGEQIGDRFASLAVTQPELVAMVDSIEHAAGAAGYLDDLDQIGNEVALVLEGLLLISGDQRDDLLRMALDALVNAARIRTISQDRELLRCGAQPV